MGRLARQIGQRLSGQDETPEGTTPRPAETRSGQARPGNPRLDRLVAEAKAALLFEQLWRALVFPLCILGLFFCLSFAGLWLEIGHAARAALVILLAGFFLFSLLSLRHVRWPSRRQALERIDQHSGIAHNPASVIDDTLANSSSDPLTLSLWALHRQRALRSLKSLRAGRPSPRSVEVDRYALRGGILVALVACAFLAGPERYARVAAAFDWRGTGAPAHTTRLDAWIDPPPYTGKAPVLLSLGSKEATSPDKPLAVEAPVNSTIIVRSVGGDARIDTSGALKEIVPEADKKEADKKDDAKDGATKTAAAPPATPTTGESEKRFHLEGDAGLTLHHAGRLVGVFSLHAIADRPPTIALTGVPKINARGSFNLIYHLNDDYGVVGAQARFSNPKNQDNKPYGGRSLVEPPHADLALAPGQGGIGDAESTVDLSDHPWAGLRVTMVLAARDEGGNEGVSEPAEITLPKKPFTNPLALSLAEQRRNLLIAPDDRAQVWTALSALLIAPEVFDTKTAVYLGLRTALDRLATAKNDADLVSLAGFLWEMALQIENGNLADAEQKLRNAEQALKDAMQRGASPEEIAKLTQDMRAAMDEFMRELAQQQQQDGNPQDAQQDRNSKNKTVTPEQLQSMLDKLQEMAKSGDMAEAQKALEQLRNILENLKTAKRGQQSQQARDAQKALSDLDKMSKDQQDLRDETYQQSRRENPSEDGFQQPQSQRPQQRQNRKGRQNPGMQNPDPDDQPDEDSLMDPGAKRRQQGQSQQDQNQQDMDELQQRQQALRNQLESLQKKLNQMGQGKQQGLDDAQSAMQEAERALSEKGPQSRDEAVEAQGRALESLRKGTQQLAEQMQQGEGQTGEGEGQEGQSDQTGEAGETDPLGRPRAPKDRSGGSNAPFNPQGVPAAQRAQGVLDELRRRLGNPNRPHEEIDYLERLLRRY